MGVIERSTHKLRFHSLNSTVRDLGAEMLPSYARDINALLEVLGADPICTVESLQDVIADWPRVILYLVFDDAKIVGMATYSIRSQVAIKELRIDNLVVLPAYRKRGIGSHLVNEAINVAINNGAPYIELNSSCHREDAHRLYEAHDFRRHPMFAFYYELRK